MRFTHEQLQAFKNERGSYGELAEEIERLREEVDGAVAPGDHTDRSCDCRTGRVFADDGTQHEPGRALASHCSTKEGQSMRRWWYRKILHRCEIHNTRLQESRNPGPWRWFCPRCRLENWLT